MEKNLDPLRTAVNDLRQALSEADRIRPEITREAERQVVLQARQALAGHVMRFWPAVPLRGTDLVAFGEHVLAVVPTLAEVRAGRQ